MASMYTKSGLLSNVVILGTRRCSFSQAVDLLFARGDLLPQTVRSGGAYPLDSVGGAEGGPDLLTGDFDNR